LFQVVSEASDGVEAAETAIALLPDVVLLDMECRASTELKQPGRSDERVRSPDHSPDT